MKLCFTIPGEPVAKASYRGVLLKRCRKCGRKSVRHQCLCGAPPSEFEPLTMLEHTNRKTRVFENLVAMYATQAMVEAGIASLMDAGLLRIRAYFLIPASRKRLQEGEPYRQRPDGDNVLKAIKDGMNKIVYADDRMIWDERIQRFWSRQARTEVELETWL